MVGVPGRSKACHTCLKRRVKCGESRPRENDQELCQQKTHGILDETRPTCKRCTKAGYICRGYERPLQLRFHTFADEGASSLKTVRDAPLLDPNQNLPGNLILRSDDDGSDSRQESLRELYARALSPQTIGNTRQDPFNSYPVKLNAREHVLVDHFMKIIPYSFYGIADRTSGRLNVNYFRDIAFPTAMTNHIAFRCLALGVPACHLAQLDSFNHSLEVEQYQARTLRLLRQHFSEQPDDLSETAISACVFRANFEMAPGFGSPRNGFIHLKQAAHIIQKRGGPKTLRHNPRLTVAVNVLDYVAPDFAARDDTILYHDSIGITHPPRSATSQYEEFLSFLKNVELLSLVQRMPDYEQLVPERHTVFESGTFVRTLITSLLRGREDFIYFRNSHFYKMVFLLYLNRTLWDFRADADLARTFLQDFARRMSLLQRDSNTSIDGAVHAMLLSFDNPALSGPHLDRLWFVGLALKIAKRFNFENWLRLSNLLSTFLTMEDQHEDTTWYGDFQCAIRSGDQESWVLPYIDPPLC